MKARPYLLLLALPLFGCEIGAVNAGNEATKVEALEAPKAPKPVRLASWPKLEAWYAGQDVSAEPTSTPALAPEQRKALGADVFALYCVNCHGALGKGDGGRSLLFEPRPRDFTKGVFKFRSTPTGSGPIEEDLFRTITGGLRGTGMPSFSDLAEEERWAVASFVKSLGEAKREEGEPLLGVQVPQDLESPARIQRGAEKFVEAGCAKCHGETLRGNGPSAETLVDAEKKRIYVPDFAVQPFKRGTSPSGTYLTLATGLDGTPMPSYASLGDETLWDLVAFVRSKRMSIAGKAPKEYADAMASYFEAQYAQSKHATIGGCGCQVRKIQNRFEQARAKAEAAPRVLTKAQ